jgi:hypothetical protein
MQTEHRRAPRHLLGGAVEVTDLESEKQIATLARNVSLFGCFVATVTPFLTGTKVRLVKLKLETERSSTPGWENSLDGWHWR